MIQGDIERLEALRAKMEARAEMTPAETEEFLMLQATACDEKERSLGAPASAKREPSLN